MTNPESEPSHNRDEGMVRLDIGSGEKLEWADEFTVGVENQCEIFLVGKDVVFLEVMQTGDVLED